MALPEMQAEELQLLQAINKKLKSRGMKSRLAYLYISGIRDGVVTEWGFEREIKEESAAANTLVSEEVATAML